tara:strand:+ start:14712 stop:15527 length:816 start_codon:yes stop_codon:yes gene_type:complete
MNIIIGKNSNLSNALAKVIDDVVLISSRDIISNIDLLEKYKDFNNNIIFNNFYPSYKLHKLSSKVDYLPNCVKLTNDILEYFNGNKINKIIYSSSASVYGDNSKECFENDQVRPLGLYASLKLENELLVADFCNEASIDYTIARNFNFYGGIDQFSIIYKLIQSCLNNTKLVLRNNGQAIRDFIHIDDVAFIYSKLLKVRNIPILNVGTGKGVSIESLVSSLINNNFHLEFKNINESEIAFSVSESELLMEIIGDYQFKDVICYLLDEVSK